MILWTRCRLYVRESSVQADNLERKNGTSIGKRGKWERTFLKVEEEATSDNTEIETQSLPPRELLLRRKAPAIRDVNTCGNLQRNPKSNHKRKSLLGNICQFQELSIAAHDSSKEVHSDPLSPSPWDLLQPWRRPKLASKMREKIQKGWPPPFGDRKLPCR